MKSVKVRGNISNIDTVKYPQPTVYQRELACVNLKLEFQFMQI